MSSPILIKGATIVDGSGALPFTADVLIADGVIKKIGKSIQHDECEIIAAAGKILSPGFN